MKEKDVDMKETMKKIVEEMADEGRPMINLAELFIKEPLSLEILMMLEGNSLMTIEHISDNIVGNARTTDVLNKLKEFKMIDFKDNFVCITNRGLIIVTKLRMKMILLEGHNF